MAENKTKPTDASVDTFIESVSDTQKRKDAYVILEMMKKITGEEPKMWGASLIGFGYELVKSKATGREVDWFRMGFSPRKANFSLYLTGNIQRYDDLLQQLGKHKTGMGCLYINKLADIDLKVLEKIMKLAAKGKWQ